MMSIAFRFRFQRLLDVRESVERQRMLELAGTLAEQEKAHQAVEHWRTQLTLSEQRLRALYQEETMSPQSVRGEHEYRLQLREELSTAEEAARVASRHVADARLALLEATKERKVMERLRERHAAEYQRSQDRREQAALDEIGSRAFGQTDPADHAASGRGETALG